MTSKSLTDKHGDVITISDGGLTLATRGHVVVHVKETTPERVHTAAAYADPDALRAALDEVAPAGSYTRTTSPDLMDGGVTSALVEEEAEAAYTRTDEEAPLRLAAEQIAEAQAEATAAVTAKEKAEQELDVWKATAQETGDSIDALLAAQPRPLTPDDITDEMVERALKSWRARSGAARVPDTVRDMLTAALTEPPTRSYWAADIEAVIRGNDGGVLDPTVAATIADRVAEFMAEQENRSAGDGS